MDASLMGRPKTVTEKLKYKIGGRKWGMIANGTPKAQARGLALLKKAAEREAAKG